MLIDAIVDQGGTNFLALGHLSGLLVTKATQISIARAPTTSIGDRTDQIIGRAGAYPAYWGPRQLNNFPSLGLQQRRVCANPALIQNIINYNVN